MRRIIIFFIFAVLVAAASFHAAAEPPKLGALDHPYLFLTASDLQVLRARAQDMEPTAYGFSTKEAWETIKARADFFLTAPPYHYEVRLPNGRLWSYTMSATDPPRHDDFPGYPPWTAMFQENYDSITTRILTLTFAYLITDNLAYTGAAKDIVLQLCRWSTWTDPSYPCGGACLDTGHATQTVATFLDWTFAQLTPAERETIRAALINKGLVPVRARITGLTPYHNFWAVLNVGLGVGALSVLAEDARAEGWLNDAVINMRLGLDEQGRDGGAYEGFMYGTYFADTFARLLDVLRSAQIPHELLDHTFYQTLPSFVINFLSPKDHYQPNIGDEGLTRGFPETLLILALNGNDYATWYLDQIGYLTTSGVGRPFNFIRFDGSTLTAREPDWNPSSLFQAIGYGVLRKGFEPASAYLSFKSGPYDREIGHNHLDHNSFIINYLGQWLATDPGYQDYFDPPRNRFTRGTIGHNSILVDGNDQARLTGGLISDFLSATSYEFIKGKAGGAYNPPLEKFDRSVIFIKPDYFLVYDELAASAAHEYTYLLHTDNFGILDPLPNGALIKKAGAQLQSWIFSPDAAEQRVTRFPGAESYGAYLEAKTRRVPRTAILSVLYPQINPDLLINPGFEYDLIGWIPRFPNNHAIDTTEFHTGRQSGKIWFTVSDTERAGYFYSNRFILPPSSPITVKGYIKTAIGGGTGRARLRILYWKNGAYLSDATGPETQTSTWTLFTIASQVPTAADQISVALEFNGTGTAWFDSILVESPEGPIATPAPEVSPLAAGQDGVLVTREGQADVVLINPPQQSRVFSFRGEMARTDGEVAIISRDTDNNFLSFTVQNGMELSLNDRLLLSASCKGVASVQFQGTVVAINATITTQHPAPLDLCGELTLYAPAAVTDVLVNGDIVSWSRSDDYIVVQPN